MSQSTTQKSTKGDDVLEQNVSTLLESGGEAPKLTDIARARMRTALIAKHGDEAASKATPMRGLRAVYEPALAWALHRRALTILLAVVFFAGSVAVASRVGSEFMPPLDEGDLLFMPIADPSISLAENTRLEIGRAHV